MLFESFVDKSLKTIRSNYIPDLFTPESSAGCRINVLDNYHDVFLSPIDRGTSTQSSCRCSARVSTQREGVVVQTVASELRSPIRISNVAAIGHETAGILDWKFMV